MNYSLSDPFSDQSLHLTHEQLCDHLLATTPFPDPATPTSDTGFHVAGFHVVEDHLRACPLCAAELRSLQSSLSNFHTATTRFADQELARLRSRAPRMQFATLVPQRLALVSQRRDRLYRSPLLWACAAALLVSATASTLVPSALHHQHRATTAAIAPLRQSSPAPESDQALLDEVDDDLSSSVPSAMQPLSDPLSTSSTDTQDSGTAALSPNLNPRKITHE
jgi:anti-sigma factor RsiW